MRRIAFTLFTLVSLYGLAQEPDSGPEPRELTATVINAQTELPLESVLVIYIKLVNGTITNQNGEYTIPAVVSDTLYLSYLGFKTQQVRVTNDMFRYGDTKISLTELAYALEEVIVRPYQLT